MTQVDAAEALGVGQPYLSSLEAGKFGRALTRVLRLLGLVGCEVVVRPRTQLSTEENAKDLNHSRAQPEPEPVLPARHRWWVTALSARALSAARSSTSPGRIRRYHFVRHVCAVSTRGLAMADFDMTWAKVDPDHVLPEIDTTRPSVARVYDAILGGKDNFAVDRVVAMEAMKAMGDEGNGARMNRAVLGRAVRYMVADGVTQFLDLGSGLPTVQNTHQIAQTMNRSARVVYVDNDPSVFLHGRALLADDASTTVVLADIRTPDKLLASNEVRGFLDFGRPVGLILNALIHHVLDEEDPYGVVETYKAALAPGSFMQLTHFCDESPESRAQADVLKRSLGRGQVRSREEITRFFDGLELVPPGIVFLPSWQPDTLPNETDPGGTLM